MIILGIESTCDETGLGIVEDGRRILFGAVSSSVLHHTKYGGVVPEVAAREQIKVIVPLLEQALAVVPPSVIDGIAVAYGPGLIGSLIVGVETAKTIALVYNKPLYAVNHLIGHIFANWLADDIPTFPLVALIVSGGHTDLLLMNDVAHYKYLGGTRDDACGEAFDKVAKLLGMGYPGGPEIERVAKLSDGQLLYRFPRPMINHNNYDFSFSGLKTAVANVTGKVKLDSNHVSAIAVAFQTAAVDVLVTKTQKAAIEYNVKNIVVCGGVSANTSLRERMQNLVMENHFRVLFPSKNLSVDNGVMIASAAFYTRNIVDPLTLQPSPSLHF